MERATWPGFFDSRDHIFTQNQSPYPSPRLVMTPHHNNLYIDIEPINLNSQKGEHMMTTKEKKNSNIKTARILEDVKINVKIKLSALWVAVMFLYIYMWTTSHHIYRGI